MNKLFVLLLAIIINACASKNDESVAVTGKRMSKAELEASGVELKPAGTIGDLVKKLSSANDGMKLPDFERGTSKRKIKRKLERRFFITSEIKNKMIVKSKSRSYQHVTVTYTFVDGLLEHTNIVTLGAF